MPYKKRSLQNRWKRAKDHAAMPYLLLHELRYSTVSEMANNGVSLHTVGVGRGIKDLRSTQRYRHLAQAPLQDTILTVDNECQISTQA